MIELTGGLGVCKDAKARAVAATDESDWSKDSAVRVYCWGCPRCLLIVCGCTEAGAAIAVNDEGVTGAAGAIDAIGATGVSTEAVSGIF